MGARTRVPIKGDLRCLVLQEHSFAVPWAESHHPSYNRSLITSYRSLNGCHRYPPPNLTVTWLEQFCVPASQTLYVYVPLPRTPMLSV
jgi:hypothetical protein